ncbi:hypothetical protein AFK68_29075 [Hydrocoleum sp. CS-953]|uniref:hypothetical protein n=1 Tax=Hydrocoleum sp. CS-953 TaxID=1671698 RepID=UPI000BD53B17|nr:hypothetical protein [Hydrocoleum sp. CS-953]OZH51713.1 hypothetical protein AFK68_29075 [Hydrocoleum sp. CS-953]
MSKIAKFTIHHGAKTPQKQQWEDNLRGKIEVKHQIRADTINDLENFSQDLQHISLVVESIHKNYQALLTENHHLKSTLLQLVDDCYCWKGNRCEKCQKILKSLAPETAKKKINITQEYKAILTQLRKLG